MKKCSNCGAVMNDEDMFCPTCGKPYENAYAAQAQQNNTTAQGAQREPYVPTGVSGYEGEPTVAPVSGADNFYRPQQGPGYEGAPGVPDTASAAAKKKKIIIISCIAAVVVIGAIVALVFAFGGKEEKKDKTTTAQTSTVQTTTQKTATTTTTTTTTTTQQVHPSASDTPAPLSFKMYIDNTNQVAFDRLEWSALDGEIDGYEIAFGMPKDFLPNQPEKWFTTENVDDANATSFDLELDYASDTDVGMARIRAYWTENGTKVYGNWSEKIELDLNNKVFL